MLSIKMKLSSLFALVALMAFAHQVVAQDSSCGDIPVEPVIVDGATATMEELVANSKEVNAYIAEADLFLDCSEARYKRLSASRIHKERVAEEVKLVTERRNEIGEEFNAQVASYQAANPQ